jgi:hypothetical protein
MTCQVGHGHGQLRCCLTIAIAQLVDNPPFSCSQGRHRKGAIVHSDSTIVVERRRTASKSYWKWPSGLSPVPPYMVRVAWVSRADEKHNLSIAFYDWM